MGELPSKIRIIAYLDKELQKKDKEVEEYIVPVNPEQYSQTFKTKYDTKAPGGQQGAKGRYIATAPEELKLDFIIDGTETIYGYKYSSKDKKSVPDQIKHLKSVVYNMSGEIHQPRLVKIQGLGIHQRGGDNVSFNGILTDLQITYNLFSPEGKPLRAKISATFLDYMESQRRATEENKKSPDLTRVRQVSSADKLPQMCNTIYADSTFYLEVAKANNLSNFRSLTTGQYLSFPPVSKTEK